MFYFLFLFSILVEYGPLVRRWPNTHTHGTPHLHGNFTASVRKVKATCMRLEEIKKKKQWPFVCNITRQSYIVDFFLARKRRYSVFFNLMFNTLLCSIRHQTFVIYLYVYFKSKYLTTHRSCFFKLKVSMCV